MRGHARNIDMTGLSPADAGDIPPAATDGDNKPNMLRAGSADLSDLEIGSCRAAGDRSRLACMEWRVGGQFERRCRMAAVCPVAGREPG